MDRLRGSLTVVAALAVLAATGVASAAVPSPAPLEVEASFGDGTGSPVPLDRIDENRPLELHPDRELLVELRLANPASETAAVRTVRLQGEVLGMTFFDYASRVDLEIEPGQTVEVVLPIDATELGGQATGRMPARLTVVSQDREALFEAPFPVDVRGSLWSTYGVFGLLVGIVTFLLLGAALTRLALRRLPHHRWLRACRFAVPGLGLGLTLTFTLSVLRVLVPSPDAWVSIVVVGGLLGLLVGFFTPGPSTDATPYDRRAVPRSTEDAVSVDRSAEVETEPSAVEPSRTIVLPDSTAVRPGARRPRSADVDGGLDSVFPMLGGEDATGAPHPRRSSDGAGQPADVAAAADLPDRPPSRS